MSIRRVLVANRGEIAVRIIHACQALGVEAVVVVSDVDRATTAARLADRAICIGGSSPTESYLDKNKVLMAAVASGCDAIHPGYGFLAESAEFAQACADNNIIFIGPKPEQIQEMGNKIRARQLAEKFKVPTLPGSARVNTVKEAQQLAQKIGFPMIIKAAAGGGGRGMRLVHDLQELAAVFVATASEAQAAFGDGALYLERFVDSARHVEVQILADSFGNVVHLGERDCSFQRRHQKLLEEAPAPNLSAGLRKNIHAAAVRFAKKFGYQNAGTVEFIVDAQAQEFYFLEMNTRIQVEHPVTEMITGIDLVQEQIKVARGEPLSFKQQDIVFRGHAIECRINAEDPANGFMPSPGVINTWQPPQGPNIRVDSHCYTGYTVPIFYDSMLAKLIVYGMDREQARARMLAALRQFRVEGIKTSIDFQQYLLNSQDFIDATMSTNLVDRMLAQSKKV